MLQATIAILIIGALIALSLYKLVKFLKKILNKS